MYTDKNNLPLHYQNDIEQSYVPDAGAQVVLVVLAMVVVVAVVAVILTVIVVARVEVVEVEVSYILMVVDGFVFVTPTEVWFEPPLTSLPPIVFDSLDGDSSSDF